MSKEPNWDHMFQGIDFSALDAAPKEPALVEQGIKIEDKVFVQKLTTETWIFTDLSNNTFGQSVIQDVTIIGEMTKEAYAKMVQQRKTRRRKKSD